MIVLGQRFSPKKSSAVHEKPNTPRSCLRWKPTGRIFKIAGLRWIPTGKMFTDNTTKVDNEPPNGSNDDTTNPYECDQTLNVSAGTTNLSAVQASLFNENYGCSHQFRPRSSTIDDVCSHQFRPRSSTIDDVCSHQFRPRSLKEKKGVRFSALYLQKKRNLLVFDHSHQHSSYFPMLIQPLSGSTYISLYCYSLVQSKMANSYAIFEGEKAAVQEPVASIGTPSSTRIDQHTPSTSTFQTTQGAQSHVIPTTVEEDDHGIEVAHMDYNL
ncbi:hypothetical protein Tco_0854517 [Tanacetum coccineum]